jgi:hypothetical protein
VKWKSIGYEIIG